VNLVAAVVAYEQPLEVVQRGEGALDHPPVRGLAISGSVWIRWSSASRYHGRYSRSFVAEIYEYQRAALAVRIVCPWFTLSGSWMFRSSPRAESIAPSHDVPDRCMPVTRIGSGGSWSFLSDGTQRKSLKLPTRECARPCDTRRSAYRSPAVATRRRGIRRDARSLRIRRGLPRVSRPTENAPPGAGRRCTPVLALGVRAGVAGAPWSERPQSSVRSSLGACEVAVA
jgi:hypothetical protein